MGAGLAGRPPCLPHSQVLMGAGLAGRPPCLLHSQVFINGYWVSYRCSEIDGEIMERGKDKTSIKV